LTEILRELRLSGGVFLDAEFTAPWCIVAQVDADDCQPFMAMPPHLIAYHYIVEGNLVVEIDGADALNATPGQLLVLPRNDRHLLASARDAAPVDLARLLMRDGETGIARIRHGGKGDRCRILCGFLGTNNAHDPLLASLPPLITLQLSPEKTGKWVEESIRFAMRDLANGGPATTGNLDRLAELLLTEAVREYVARLPADQQGWMASLKDPVVGNALALIHGQPGRRWTLDDLAREVATSRSVLGERFTRLLGVPPIDYQRRQQLGRAADSLSQTSRPLASIALEAGYNSEAAFSRSFKRAYGSSPGAFREATRKLR
jgi:AraC-like DNA-binding protein